MKTIILTVNITNKGHKPEEEKLSSSNISY